MLSFLFSLYSFAMPSSDFQLLKNQVDDASFSSDKQSIIEMAIQRSTFTCDQIKVLLSAISFESDQLNALRTLAPKIEDPERSFIILDAFTFSSSKEEAKRILQEKAPKQSQKERLEAEKQALIEKQREQERKEQEEKAKAERELEKQREQERIDNERAKAEYEREGHDQRHRRDDASEMEEGPLMQWLGRCRKNNTECVRFQPSRFSPLSSGSRHSKNPNHDLLLEVSGPGVLQITANMGKKYSCKRDGVRRKSDPLRIQKDISLAQGRNLINVSDLIPDWQREYAEIKVEKGFMTSIIRLDDWNRCP